MAKHKEPRKWLKRLPGNGGGKNPCIRFLSSPFGLMVTAWLIGGLVWHYSSSGDAQAAKLPLQEEGGDLSILGGEGSEPSQNVTELGKTVHESTLDDIGGLGDVDPRGLGASSSLQGGDAEETGSIRTQIEHEVQQQQQQHLGEEEQEEQEQEEEEGEGATATHSSSADRAAQDAPTRSRPTADDAEAEADTLAGGGEGRSAAGEAEEADSNTDSAHEVDSSQRMPVAGDAEEEEEEQEERKAASSEEAEDEAAAAAGGGGGVRSVRHAAADPATDTDAEDRNFKEVEEEEEKGGLEAEEAPRGGAAAGAGAGAGGEEQQQQQEEEEVSEGRPQEPEHGGGGELPLAAAEGRAGGGAGEEEVENENESESGSDDRIPRGRGRAAGGRRQPQPQQQQEEEGAAVGAALACLARGHWVFNATPRWLPWNVVGDRGDGPEQPNYESCDARFAKSTGGVYGDAAERARGGGQKQRWRVRKALLYHWVPTPLPSAPTPACPFRNFERSAFCKAMGGRNLVLVGGAEEQGLHDALLNHLVTPEMAEMAGDLSDARCAVAAAALLIRCGIVPL
eukprot:jgi/Mesen1/5297/ME000264S04323